MKIETLVEEERQMSQILLESQYNQKWLKA